MTFWVNRPPNAERTPKHCITKRKSSTEDRLLRHLKRLSGNRLGYIVCFVCFVFCCFYFVVFCFWTNNCIFPAFGETLFLGLLFLVISSSINIFCTLVLGGHGFVLVLDRILHPCSRSFFKNYILDYAVRIRLRFICKPNTPWAYMQPNLFHKSFKEDCATFTYFNSLFVRGRQI